MSKALFILLGITVALVIVSFLVAGRGDNSPESETEPLPVINL